MTITGSSTTSVGRLLRDWRMTRRLSQLDLACEAGISQRHLSFVESGRAQPSRDMIARLCEHLEVPLRERNVLLLAAGYAPAYGEYALQTPAMSGVAEALQLILTAHEPHPALVADRRWNLVAGNATAGMFLAHASPALTAPPVNLVRLSLHPEGLADRIVNYEQWREHTLMRLRRQLRAYPDAEVAALVDEVSRYPARGRHAPDTGTTPPGTEIYTPLVYRTDAGELEFLTTTTIFGTACEVTLSELTLETFYPANSTTAAAIRALVAPAAAST